MRSKAVEPSRLPDRESLAFSRTAFLDVLGLKQWSRKGMRLRHARSRNHVVTEPMGAKDLTTTSRRSWPGSAVERPFRRRHMNGQCRPIADALSISSLNPDGPSQTDQQSDDNSGPACPQKPHPPQLLFTCSRGADPVFKRPFWGTPRACPNYLSHQIQYHSC